VEHQEVIARILQLANQALGANLVENDLSGVKKLDELIGFDSMTSLQWVTAIEQEFHIILPPEKLRLDFLVDLPALADFLYKTIIEAQGASHS
jgi:acyl carrier protein